MRFSGQCYWCRLQQHRSTSGPAAGVTAHHPKPPYWRPPPEHLSCARAALQDGFSHADPNQANRLVVQRDRDPLAQDWLNLKKHPFAWLSPTFCRVCTGFAVNTIFSFHKFSIQDPNALSFPILGANVELQFPIKYGFVIDRVFSHSASYGTYSRDSLQLHLVFRSRDRDSLLG